MVHSPTGPSGGHRWINCPGSVAATEHLPDTTNDFAEEGLFAHHISELARLEHNDAEYYFGFTSEDGKWSCDREMVTAVQDFLDYCEQWEGEVFIEQRVSYDAWVKGGFGTSDHICINADTKHVLVKDFKYGKGIQIFAEDNEQGLLYALGVYQDFSHLYDIDEFTISISQPRIHHRDQWDISTEELLTWAEEVAEPASVRVEDARNFLEKTGEIPEDYFEAGDWCQWCKIKGECKTRAALMRQTALIGVEELDDLDPEAVTGQVNVLSDDELGEAMGIVDQMRKWCTDIEEAVKKAVMAGRKIVSGYDDDEEEEYWKMVEGRSNRRWIDEEAAAESLKKKARLKVGEIYTRKIIGPAPAEKLIGEDHKALVGMIEKPQGKPVLVPGSDRREPYAVAKDELEDLDEDLDTSWLDD